MKHLTFLGRKQVLPFLLESIEVSSPYPHPHVGELTKTPYPLQGFFTPAIFSPYTSET